MAGKDETLRVRVSTELKARLEAIAERRQIDLSDLVRIALESYIGQQDEMINTIKENTELLREFLDVMRTPQEPVRYQTAAESRRLARKRKSA